MMHLYMNGSDGETVQRLSMSSCRNTSKHVCFPVSIEISCKNIFTKQNFHKGQRLYIEGYTERSGMNGFERWEHFHCLCCSIGLQWPNPHNKESLWFTHCLLEKMGRPANCQSTISSLLSHCFSFLGLPWPTELRWPASSTVLRTEGGGVGGVRLHWSQLASNRLYHYCSLSACSIQRKNDREDNPQSSLSGPADWKLLDCLIIKNGFSWEAEWHVGSPVGQKIVAGQSEWNLLLFKFLRLSLFLSDSTLLLSSTDLCAFKHVCTCHSPMALFHAQSVSTLIMTHFMFLTLFCQVLSNGTMMSPACPSLSWRRHSLKATGSVVMTLQQRHTAANAHCVS